MSADRPTSARLLVRRGDLSQLRLERPCADAPSALQPGQARLRIEHFALTANNITYAHHGLPDRRLHGRAGCL